MDVCITQLITKVALVHYSREEMIDLLRGIDNDRDLGAMGTRELATLLVDAANDDGNDPVNGLWDRLARQSLGTEETIDSGDWEVTDVYGEKS